MRIKEIVTEYVDVPKAQANGNAIDAQVLKDIEKKKRKERGEDPDLEEVVQDFPV
jgi:hypothetical protein